MKTFFAVLLTAAALATGAVSANAGNELSDLDMAGQIVTVDGYAGPR